MVPFTINRRNLLRFGAGVLAATAGSFPRAEAAAPDPVLIANAAGNMNLTLQQLMKQQKFLESFDLSPDVMDIADGTKILAGILSGEVDCSTMSGFGQVFPAIEKGGRIKVLAGAALLPSLAVFSAKPDVRSITDLAGRTVGVGSLGALLHQLMVALLLKKGVNPEHVRFVNIGSSAEVFRAVVAGVVDAGPGEVAILNEAERYHVHGLDGGNMSEELPEFTYQGAWTSQRTIESKRSILVRCLAAYAKLYRFVQTPAAHDPFMAAWSVVSRRAETKRGEALWGYVQKYKPFAVDLVLTPQRLDYMQRLNMRVHVQRSLLPFDRVADMSIAEEALKLL